MHVEPIALHCTIYIHPKASTHQPNHPFPPLQTAAAARRPPSSGCLLATQLQQQQLQQQRPLMQLASSRLVQQQQRGLASSGKGGKPEEAESHDDFKPQRKAPPADLDGAMQMIDEQVRCAWWLAVVGSYQRSVWGRTCVLIYWELGD